VSSSLFPYKPKGTRWRTYRRLFLHVLPNMQHSAVAAMEEAFS